MTDGGDKVDQLVSRIVALEMQLNELRPQILPAADVEQPTNVSHRDADFLRSVAGGAEKITQCGADHLFAGTSTPMPTSLMRAFPPEVFASGQYVCVTGSTHSVGSVEDGDGDEPGVYAEYGRLALYPLLISASIGFYNGQIGSVTGDAVKSVYRHLRPAASSIVAVYGYPFVPYFDAAIVMYHLGCASSPQMYVVEPMKLDVGHFPERRDATENLPSSPYATYTLRHRVGEVYRILEIGMRWYCRVHGADRRMSHFFVTPTRGSVASLVANKRHALLVHAKAAAVGCGEREALGAEMFRDTSTDIAGFLASVYQLAVCKNRMQDARSDAHTHAVIGQARGLIAGFIVHQFTYKRDSIAETAHLRRLVPVVLFLNEMLSEFGAAIRADLIITYDRQ